MPRKPRISPVDVPQHIIVRGNNRQVCFADADDMAFYLGYLKKYSEKNGLEVHAWVLMTNHMHLLCTPKFEKSVSKTMQDMGRMYVLYFNKKYKRTGTLWEGRYKSSLIQAENYLLSVYRYIELNPVRAGMIDDPANYPFSSYQINALGKKSKLCTPHKKYIELGVTNQERQESYKGLFIQDLPNKFISDIREVTSKGMALGNDRFLMEIKKLTGYDLTIKSRGRPKGWRKKDSEK